MARSESEHILAVPTQYQRSTNAVPTVLGEFCGQFHDRSLQRRVRRIAFLRMARWHSIFRKVLKAFAPLCEAAYEETEGELRDIVSSFGLLSSCLS